MTEPIPITQPTFGVEFEVILPLDNNGAAGRDAIAAALVAAGLPARHDPLTHRAVPYWRVTTDSTIGYENAEIVSPSLGEFVMHGEAGFEMLRKAARVISAFGCTVDARCGTHVHVGVRDSDYQRLGLDTPHFERLGFFKELVKTYSKFEPVFDSLMARSRRESNNSMCRPITFTPAAERATTIDQLLRAYGLSRHGNDRHYSKLNLGAYIRHGTVEFRQHQGTTNIQKIENWVKLCLRMVAHSARNTEMASERGEFVPPRAPLLPPPPRFADGGVAVVSPPVITSRSNLSYQRHIDRLTYAAQQGNWLAVERYADRVTGTNTYARIVQGYRQRLLEQRRQNAEVTPGELARREAAIAEHAATVRRMRAEHEAAVSAARAAWEAGRGSAGVVSRPPTDAAPTTLEGLLSLVSAVESERAYFTERQMELN